MKKNTRSIEYDKLKKLHSLKRQRERLAKEEKLLSQPLCNDPELLDKLYFRFMQVVRELPGGMCPDHRASRKLFLFIALYLYSPATLTGGRLDHGVRSALMRIMNFGSPASVTYHCEGLGLWCGMYPDFRCALDYVFPRMLGAVEE